VLEQGIFNSRKISLLLKHKISIRVPNAGNIIVELDGDRSPDTVRKIIASLPFKAKANIWGKEVYTDPIPVETKEENATLVVSLFDVAYWPPGRAICLFYGPTPLDKEQITPYSPVNIIGKIRNPDKAILSQIDGAQIIFESL
jgi:uncharacterized protein